MYAKCTRNYAVIATHAHAYSYTHNWIRQEKQVSISTKQNKQKRYWCTRIPRVISRKWKKNWPGFYDDASSSILPNISIYIFESQKLFVFITFKNIRNGKPQWNLIGGLPSIFSIVYWPASRIKSAWTKISVNCKSQMGFWVKTLETYYLQ